MHIEIDREAARATGTGVAALEAVGRLFGTQLESGLHPAAALAVRRDGRLLLAARGGTMEPGEPGPEVSADTLFLIFSATKPLTSTAVHLLAERGKIDLDAPVARYWPEFGQRGKERVTIAHVLSHRGGFPLGPKWFTWEHWRDPAALTRAMEERTLRWEPGTDVGYHPLNFGWALGELVRRVDGRSLGRFLRDEVLQPLALRDTFLGLPPELDARVAHLIDLSGESDFVADFNRPEVHATEAGAATCITTPEDMTRFYTMLLRGGELDGVRILRPETIARATRVVSDGQRDRTLQVPMRWASGFHLGGPATAFGRKSTPEAFGHSGHGSTTAWAEPARGLAVAYFTTGVQASIVNFVRMSRMNDAVLTACGA